MTGCCGLQAKTKELKNSLNTEFGQIHSLCLFVLNASKKPSLIKATLATLHAFLSWIPLGYIFESNLVEVLLTLFPQAPFRNASLQCLTEVRYSSLCRVYVPQHASPFDPPIYTNYLVPCSRPV